MGTTTTIENIKEKLKGLTPVLEEKYGVSRVGIFGSYSRGEEKKGSDLDLLVDLQQPIGLFKIVELEDYLSDELAVKVDLVTERALSPYIKNNVLGDLKIVYGEKR